MQGLTVWTRYETSGAHEGRVYGERTLVGGGVAIEREVKSESGVAKDLLGCFRSIGERELIDQSIEEALRNIGESHSDIQRSTGSLVFAICLPVSVQHSVEVDRLITNAGLKRECDVIPSQGDQLRHARHIIVIEAQE